MQNTKLSLQTNLDEICRDILGLNIFQQIAHIASICRR